jgi:hypothetical protein
MFSPPTSRAEAQQRDREDRTGGLGKVRGDEPLRLIFNAG